MEYDGLRMAMIDPDEERRRLEQFYAGKSDGELAEVAEEASDLTEVARETLRAELTKRGLYVGEVERPESDAEAEFRELVEIRRYWNLLDGELAKGLLESAGIEAFLFDDNMLRMDWFNANAIGGVKLRVDATNVAEANRVLEEEERASANATVEETESDGEAEESST